MAVPVGAAATPSTLADTLPSVPRKARRARDDGAPPQSRDCDAHCMSGKRKGAAGGATPGLAHPRRETGGWVRGAAFEEGSINKTSNV